AAIQRFLNSAVIKTLLFTENDPKKEYLCDPVDLTGYDRKEFVGRKYWRSAAPIIRNPAYGDSFFGDCNGVLFQNIHVYGQKDNTSNVSRGIHLNGWGNRVVNVFVRWFNDEGVWLLGGGNFVMDSSGWDCCGNFNATERRGALRLSGTDDYAINCQFGCSQNVDDWRQITSENLYNIGVLLEGANSMFVNVHGENSDVGICLTGPNGINRLTNCRGDQSWGHGWIIESPKNQIVNALAENISLEGENLYDGFHTTGQGNRFANCHVRAIDRFDGIKLPRYAFFDGVSAGNAWQRNNYTNCGGDHYTAEFKAAEWLGSAFEDKPHVVRDTTTTPNVTRTSFIWCAATEGSTITGFSGDVWPGKRVLLLAENDITLADSWGFQLRGRASRALSAGESAEFIYNNTVWREVGSAGESIIKYPHYWGAGNIAAGSSVTSAPISVYGARYGDHVSISPSDPNTDSTVGLITRAVVSADGQVQITLFNPTGAAISANTTWQIRVTPG
ncbi:hypothetical protein CKO11_16915, partial [Rhodobacter sp. TJ_12]|uniref:hypothetical protein n=1 Tax=Rhodobacter sp. TJ_12 TaxID=2029399 RepID=UPI001CBD8002